MNFTYESYGMLIEHLRLNGYEIADYHNWKQKSGCVILRHDIDYDLSKSVKMAQFEKKIGIKSTYFVLVTSDLYNVFSKTSEDCLKEILDCGHEIGLHFDEVRYPELEGNIEAIRERIINESKLLESVICSKVSTVSMHRPSKLMLESDLKIPGIINSYGNDFFKGFKYLSDSRRRWREPAEDIIAKKQYERLHILTHAFWYEENEIDIHDSIVKFINNGNKNRYVTMKNNITDLSSIMSQEEVQ